jgi:hypothetical protein
VFALNILDFVHRNLGFEPGSSDLFDHFFFGTFLVKNNVDAKRRHKMKKFKRQCVDYGMLIRIFKKLLEMTFKGFSSDIEND